MAKSLALSNDHTVRLYEQKRLQEYVTMRVGGQLFGISVLSVQDVLRWQRVTRVPLAPAEIEGLLNLRGRIVTAMNLRHFLGLPRQSEQEKVKSMSVVVEHKGELFSMIVDAVGEVMSLPAESVEKSPSNLSLKWKDITSGVYKLDGELLVILDVASLLDIPQSKITGQ